MNAYVGHAPGPSGLRKHLAERQRLARHTLRRAGTVVVVLALGGVLHAMRWASLMGL